MSIGIKLLAWKVFENLTINAIASEFDLLRFPECLNVSFQESHSPGLLVFFKGISFTLLKIKVAILGSTRGTSIQKLLDCRKEKNISVELIIANRKSAEIMEKAKKASIPFHYAPKKKSQTN